VSNYFFCFFLYSRQNIDSLQLPPFALEFISPPRFFHSSEDSLRGHNNPPPSFQLLASVFVNPSDFARLHETDLLSRQTRSLLTAITEHSSLDKSLSPPEYAVFSISLWSGRITFETPICFSPGTIPPPPFFPFHYFKDLIFLTSSDSPGPRVIACLCVQTPTPSASFLFLVRRLGSVLVFTLPQNNPKHRF